MSRSLRIASALMVVVVAGTLLRAADEKPAATDKDQLQGTWKVVAMHEGDKAMTDADIKEMAMSLKFEGDQVSSIMAEGDPKPATYKLDTTKTPKQITVSPTKGGEAGKTYNGIYELAGDTFTISFASDADKPFPTDFKPAEKKIVIKLSKAK